MSTTWLESYSFLRIFKGRRERTMASSLYTSPQENLNSLQTRTKETFKEATDGKIIEMTIDAIRVLILARHLLHCGFS
jgi:hypothetical protein